MEWKVRHSTTRSVGGPRTLQHISAESQDIIEGQLCLILESHFPLRQNVNLCWQAGCRWLLRCMIQLNMHNMHIQLCMHNIRHKCGPRLKSWEITNIGYNTALIQYFKVLQRLLSEVGQTGNVSILLKVSEPWLNQIHLELILHRPNSMAVGTSLWTSLFFCKSKAG